MVLPANRTCTTLPDIITFELTWIKHTNGRKLRLEKETGGEMLPDVQVGWPLLRAPGVDGRLRSISR